MNSLESLLTERRTWLGRRSHFWVAALSIVVWAISGPFFGFSDTWQLAINTSTTIMTFLMVFLIQNTQNRDSRALHLKLDELIRANNKARNRIVDLEEEADDVLRELQDEFRKCRTEGESLDSQGKS